MNFRPLLLACLWLAALPAFGQGVEFLHPLPGATLAAGDEIVVRWQGAPRNAAEMELLLSVDGGRRFAVRLTRELAGDATSCRLRIPALPSRAARLALRAKVDGAEVEVGSSAPFAIFAEAEGKAPWASGGSAGSVRLVRGELWWLEGAVAGSEGERLALSGLEAPPAGPRVLPAAGESILADLRVPDLSPRPAAGAAEVPQLPAAPRRSSFARPAARTPLQTPLRI